MTIPQSILDDMSASLRGYVQDVKQSYRDEYKANKARFLENIDLDPKLEGEALQSELLFLVNLQAKRNRFTPGFYDHLVHRRAIAALEVEQEGMTEAECMAVAAQ